MGRPQSLDVDDLLDHARAIWVAERVAAVTIRALSARSGVSNGAIYHHFASRNHLLAQVWAREASGFLAFQAEEVRRAREAGTATDAVVAAALATGAYSVANADATRVLMASRPGSSAGDGVPETLQAQLRQYRASAATLLADLAHDLWSRRDATAVTVVRACAVDIPARLFVTARSPNDPLARFVVERAVRGVLAEEPPR
ncbi:AcrR family transcriptional regulator [Marmoricola sp. OAE513]|uniref:TetR/AcrR family transcriptional regulator n=1 Tax=Marmoricola sp. OAE513 TaxID=2817894 RepID=UPI001AE153B8